MATIENKVFKSLLDNYVIERQSRGVYTLSNEVDDRFFFWYDVNQDAITDGGYELSEGQEEQIKDLCYDFHNDSQPEDSNDAFEHIIDHYSETGTDYAMFI